MGAHVFGELSFVDHRRVECLCAKVFCETAKLDQVWPREFHGVQIKILDDNA